jgi:hypothetical protein
MNTAVNRYLDKLRHRWFGGYLDETADVEVRRMRRRPALILNPRWLQHPTIMAPSLCR